MSSADIENVLSSIRRLVTDELRPRVPEPSAPAVPPSTDAVPGKLLLTPALRVVEQEPSPSPSRPPIDGLLSIIGARVAAPPAGFEAETGDAFDAAAEPPPRPLAASDTPPDAPLRLGDHGTPAVSDDDDDAEDGLDGSAPPVVDLDEDVLRELIRDVLCEELQGQMGERMTRNIRKLVRAELARAVAVRTMS